VVAYDLYAKFASRAAEKKLLMWSQQELGEDRRFTAQETCNIIQGMGTTEFIVCGVAGDPTVPS